MFRRMLIAAAIASWSFGCHHGFAAVTAQRDLGCPSRYSTRRGSPSPTIHLGKLEYVDPKSIWAMEAVDFAAWLAENLALLGETLGLDLELVKTEASVGSFACDIQPRDTGSGRRVIIENQLAQTDHGHLGQLITYAAGLDAAVIVWIAPKVREEHREAIDFLNHHTRKTLDFFVIALEVVRISGSLPAVVFKLAASPNAWAKTTAASASKPVSDNSIAYQKFYQGLMDDLRDKHNFTNARAAQPQNWYSFSSGKPGITYTTTFASGNRLRAELYIDVGDTVEKQSNLRCVEVQRGSPSNTNRGTVVLGEA